MTAAVPYYSNATKLLKMRYLCLETLLFSHSAPLSYKRLDLSPRIHNCRYHDPGLVLITHVLDIIRLDVLIRRVHLIIPRSL